MKRFLVLMILPALAFCARPVLEFREGAVSPGTFQYIQESLYPQKTSTEILDILKEKEVSGSLADRQGFLKDSYYLKYLTIQSRSRRATGANHWFKKKFGRLATRQDYFQVLLKEYNEERILEEISNNLAMEESRRVIRNPRKISLGTVLSKSLNLSHLRKLMTYEEWNRFQGLRPLARKNALRESLTFLIHKVVNQKLMKELDVKTEELLRFDHNMLSETFLNVRYGQAHKGIYPTSALSVKLKHLELLEYFNRIKQSLLPVKNVTYRTLSFTNSEDAERFLKTLTAGKKSSPGLKGWSKSLVIQPGNIEFFHLKPPIEKYIFSSLSQETIEPLLFHFNGKHTVIEIQNVKRESRNLKFADYKWELSHRRTTELLRRQLETDKRDTRKALRFR